MEQKNRTAAIIAVGDEVLCGDTVNTNASYIAKKLDALGVRTLYQCVIPDEEEMIISEVKKCSLIADMIITSGGLGPTNDDITKEALTKALGLKSVFDENTGEKIHSFFARINSEETPNNKKQCYVPEGAEAIENNNGSAPGVYLELNAKTYIMLPGPPRELIPMFEEGVLSRIAPKLERSFSEKYYMLSGIGESQAEQMMRDALPVDENYTVNTYISESGVRLKATAYGHDENKALELIEKYDKMIKALLGKYIFSEKAEELWEYTARLLMEKNLSVTAAESCTGGMLAEKLTSVPGVSEVFKGSFVTYSNEAKMRLLGVKKETLESFTEVSEPTAEEMARGAAEYFGADIAVGITGIAGPGGGSEEKPVGLVYISAYCKGKVKVEKHIYNGNRDKVRAKAVADALKMIRECAENC